MENLALVVSLLALIAGLIALVWVVVDICRDPMRGEVEVDITGWYQRRWHRKNRQQ